VQVFVRDNDVNSALRVLKKKMQREGTFREMKRRRSYEKPSERRVRERAEGIRRYRKAMRKRKRQEAAAAAGKGDAPRRGWRSRADRGEQAARKLINARRCERRQGTSHKP
jgi:small subunit ribosomal protein S21